MRRIFLLRFLMIMIVSFVSICFENSVLAQNAPNLDEYSVYTAILQKEYIGIGTKQIVIRKQTSVDNFSAVEPLVNLLESLPLLTEGTIEDFSFRNKKSATLTDKFNLRVKVNLVGEEINKIFYRGRQQDSPEDGWEIFNKKYPSAGGIITLSRVGFNKEKTQALIFVSHGCGWRCGEGNYILLVKKDKEWKIEKKLMNWVS